MKVLTKEDKLKRVSEDLKKIEFKIFKNKSGYQVKVWKKVVVVDGIPEEALADYIAKELGATAERMSEKVKEYVELTNSKVEQLQCDLFKKEQNENNTSSENIQA